jgi:hypothetical protein
MRKRRAPSRCRRDCCVREDLQEAPVILRGVRRGWVRLSRRAVPTAFCVAPSTDEARQAEFHLLRADHRHVWSACPSRGAGWGLLSRFALLGGRCSEPTSRCTRCGRRSRVAIRLEEAGAKRPWMGSGASPTVIHTDTTRYGGSQEPSARSVGSYGLTRESHLSRS